MIVGTRTEATNTQAIGTSTTVYNMIGIASGKTFVLTDVIAAGSWNADGPVALLSNCVLNFYDFSGDGATAASTASTPRLTVNMPAYNLASIGGDLVNTTQRGGTVLHFPNGTGPEFTNGVTPGIGGAANAYIIGTGCVWVSGIIR